MDVIRASRPRGAFRKKLRKSTSKRIFRRTSRVHKENVMSMPMRGGIRL